MTTKTTPTREQIEQQAAELAAQVDAFRQQDEQRAEEEWNRRLEAQREFDRQLVAAHSDARLETEVSQARSALDTALAESPWVIALADYLSALRRRSHAAFEDNSARSRLGLPTGPTYTGATEIVGVDEYVIRAAERMAAERIEAEQAELHARREAAGSDS